MEAGRSSTVTILACLLALVVGLTAPSAYAHLRGDAALDAGMIALHPFMGASLVIDENGRALDAVDHAAAGHALSSELSALVVSAQNAGACRKQKQGGYEVRVCPVDPGAHALQGAIAQPVSIDVDGERVPTATQLSMIPGRSGVRTIEARAGSMPVIITADGRRIPAMMFAPPTQMVVTELARVPGCAAKGPVVTCHA
jgi:hypothetical protein